MGEAAGERFGFVNRVLGDLDADGIPDAGVGVPESTAAGAGTGRVYVYSGRTGRLLRTHDGAPSDRLGYEISGVGDLNGDGASEYILGAPGTIDFYAVTGNGHAYLHDGATGALLHTFTGEALRDGFGGICAGAGNVLDDLAGDINADGVPDIIITALLADPAGAASGRAYVYSGAPPYTLIHRVNGLASADLFGFSAGGLGDLDGDGHGEFVIGAPNAGPGNRGAAYVFDGASGDLRFSMSAELEGLNFGMMFASGPGDVSGDGVPDVFVSDLGWNGIGRSYVYSGVDGTLLFTMTGEASGDGFGVGRGAGDVDGDGVPDFIVSSFSSDVLAPNAGRAFVISGADQAVLRTITGTIEQDYLGYSTVALGDVDEDGTIDFMISAVGHDTGATDAGRVYVISGALADNPADITGDGAVDVADLLVMLSAWGPCRAPCPPACTADVDASCAVDVADLLALLAAWN